MSCGFVRLLHKLSHYWTVFEVGELDLIYKHKRVS